MWEIPRKVSRRTKAPIDEIVTKNSYDNLSETESHRDNNNMETGINEFSEPTTHKKREHVPQRSPKQNQSRSSTPSATHNGGEGETETQEKNKKDRMPEIIIVGKKKIKELIELLYKDTDIINEYYLREKDTEQHIIYCN